MAETNFKQTLLSGAKTERIGCVVTPGLRRAVVEMVQSDCVSASAFMVSLLADEAVRRAK